MKVKYCRIVDGERVGCGEGRLDRVLARRRDGELLRVHGAGVGFDGVEFTGSPDTWPGPMPVHDESDVVRLSRRRKAALNATDVLALPDSPLDDSERNEVLAFRQGLRDLPQTNTWPTPPEWLAARLGDKVRSEDGS